MADNSFVIDLGEKYTRLADAKLSNKKIAVNSLEQVETSPIFYFANNEKSIDAQAEIINKLWSSSRLKKKDVRLIIPDTYSYSHVLEVPKLNEKELQSAIRYHADQFIPLPIEEVSLDLEILNEDASSKKATILIIASPKALISQIEKTVERAGLFPESLENELSSVRRFLTEQVNLANGKPYLVINFGFSSSSIYFFDAQNRFLLSRTFKIGLGLIIKDVKVNLNVDEKKAEEILRSLGLSANGSIDIEGIILPIIKEFIDELNKFVLLAKDQYNFIFGGIYLFNYDYLIPTFAKKIESMINIPTLSLNLQQMMIDSPLIQSHRNEISSYFTAITGNFR
jgi:type IV pilus assembly protein PilM